MKDLLDLSTIKNLLDLGTVKNLLNVDYERSQTLAL